MARTTPPRAQRIWVTRTQPGAEATGRRLRELGFDPLVAPVLEVRVIADVVLDLAGVDAIAVTSAAALDAFAALCPRRDLPLFAVGEASAARARAAGFGDTRSADGDGDALAALIAAATPPPRQVLNPTAREPAVDLPALLAEHGIAARAVCVYETMNTALSAAPGGVDGLLIHSAKAARRVAQLLDPAIAANLDLAAMSQAAAKPLADFPFRRIVIAARPNEAALLAMLQDPDRSMTSALQSSAPARAPKEADAHAYAYGPRLRRLGLAFWAMIAFGFFCAVAGLALARFGPQLFPPKPVAHAASPRTLGNPLPPR